MRISSFVPALLLIACSVSITAKATTPSIAPATAAARVGPAVSVDHKVIDQGEVNFGEAVKYAYELTNVGTEDVVFEKLDTECGCTEINSAELTSAPIKPGESVTLVATLFTHRVVPGKVSKLVRVITNDAKDPYLSLELRALVIERMRIEPKRVALRTFRGSNADTGRKVTLLSTEGVAFKIISVDSSDPELLVTVTPASKTTATISHELRVALPPNAKFGAHPTELTIQTTHPKQPEFRFKVAAELAGAVIVVPSLVDLGELSKGAPSPAPKQVRVEQRGGKDFIVTRATTTNPAFKATAKRLNESVYEIEIASSSADLAGLAEGKLAVELKIESNDADQPELTVPLIAKVRP